MIRAAALGLAMLGATQAFGDAGPPALAGARLEPVAFAALAGWAEDDHGAALEAFRRGCGARAERAGSAPTPALARACAAAAEVAPAAARAFFESRFRPFRIAPDAGRGFLTGYYEPEFAGSLTPNPAFPTPLHARPDDLVTVAAGERLPGLPAGLQGARRLGDGRFAAFPTRREIDGGALGPEAPVVAWLRDPVDRFIMQVQGSGRIRLPDGAVARLSYAGRNGHPYVSLGRLMSRRLAVPPAEMTMDRLVERLKAEPDPNRAWIWENPSYVFFRLATELDAASGPVGGAGHPLTAGRSVAADRALWAYNLPVWLSGALPTPERGVDEPLARLMVIQDTGSAIVGPSRFDYFHGAGDLAGRRAGLTRHGVDAVILWPVGGG